MMEQQLSTLITKAQKNHSDIIGFAGVTHRKLPSFWKSMPSVWDDVYEDTKFNITAKINIFSSSITMNPIKVGR